MNLTLAKQAERDVLKGDAEQSKGFCLRSVRQLAEHTPIGTKYDHLFRGDGTHRDATAARAGRRFLNAGLGFKYSDRVKHGGLQPGDILVKTDVAPNRWGDFSGHIGVLCIDKSRVAENSSTGKGRTHGALGFRKLSEWGTPDIVVRLPDPATMNALPEASTPSIIITKWENGKAVDKRFSSKLEESQNWMPIQELLQFAEIPYSVAEWGDGTPNIRIAPK